MTPIRNAKNAQPTKRLMSKMRLRTDLIVLSTRRAMERERHKINSSVPFDNAGGSFPGRYLKRNTAEKELQEENERIVRMCPDVLAAAGRHADHSTPSRQLHQPSALRAVDTYTDQVDPSAR
jgi:hypothetical protein